MTPDPVGFCIAQDMVAVRADPKKIYPRYLFALLRSHDVQTKIENMHVGTLIPHFKKGDFDKLKLPIPDRAELGLLNRGQCAALAGLAPYDNDSGTFTGQRSICGGRSDVRAALYMAAVTAARHNAVLRGFYERLIQAKKPFKVAITAVMRKLLLYLNSLLKTAAINGRSDLSIIAPV